MADVCQEIINSGRAVDALCDQRLFLAGLSGRWQPLDVSESVSELGRHLADAGTSEPQPETQHAARKLGTILGDIAHRSFSTNCEGPYRAAKAIDAERGNCIAYHEVVAGYMATVGVSAQAYGIWSGFETSRAFGNHAESGLVVGDQLVEIDGFHGRSSTVSEASDPERFEACKTVVEEPKALVVDADAVSILGIVDDFRLDELHKINVRDNDRRVRHQKIILPAVAAILMFSSVAVQRSRRPELDEARDVLRNFAPLL